MGGTAGRIAGIWPSKARRGWVQPAAVLIAGALASILVAWRLDVAAARDEARRLERWRAVAVQAVSTRMEAQAALLRGVAGLFSAAEASGAPVTPTVFRRYVGRLRLAETYPGVQGVGFSIRLGSPSEEISRVAALRAQGLLPRAEWTPWPDRPGAERHAILFLEPQDRRNAVALGFDMSSEPARAAAMERAMRLALPAMSGPVELVQEIEGQKQAGFLIYVPIYRGGGLPEREADRRAALIGFAYSPFRANDLFDPVFAHLRSRVVEIAISDAEAGRPFYATASVESARMGTRLELFGRNWIVQVTKGPDFPRTGRIEPWAALLAGLSLSTVLAAAVAIQVRAARRLAEANGALARSLQRQETLTREMNHRVANSLAMVSSFAQVQAGALSDPAARAALEALRGRIAAIVQVHRRLYAGTDVERVALDLYLRDLVTELGASLGGGDRRVRLECRLAPLAVPTDVAISLGVIVTEVVINAFKYAYPEDAEGPVRVTLHAPQNGHARLEVEDEGVGHQGGAPAGTGAGQRIVAATARAIGARVEQNPAERGMRVAVVFPVDH